MERVRMGYLIEKFFLRDFLRVHMEGFVWDSLIENFFERDFLRVRVRRVHMGYFNKDFPSVHIVGGSYGISLIENFF